MGASTGGCERLLSTVRVDFALSIHLPSFARLILLVWSCRRPLTSVPPS